MELTTLSVSCNFNEVDASCWLCLSALQHHNSVVVWVVSPPSGKTFYILKNMETRERKDPVTVIGCRNMRKSIFLSTFIFKKGEPCYIPRWSGLWNNNCWKEGGYPPQGALDGKYKPASVICTEDSRNETFALCFKVYSIPFPVWRGDAAANLSHAE